jgi:hypothetical protein
MADNVVRVSDLPASTSVTHVVGTSGTMGNSTRIALGALAALLGVAASSTRIAFPTKAHMNAQLGYDAWTVAEVLSDTTPANNGTYIKLGASGTGSWSYQGPTTTQAIISELEAHTITAAGLLSGGGTVGSNPAITATEATVEDAVAGVGTGFVTGRIFGGAIANLPSSTVTVAGSFEVAPYSTITHLLTDEYGFALAALYLDGTWQTATVELGPTKAVLPTFEFSSKPALSSTVNAFVNTEGTLSFTDDFGFEVPFTRDVFATSSNGGAAEFDATPLFSGTLYGVEYVEYSVYPRQLFASRDFPDNDVMVTLGGWSASDITPCGHSGRDEIRFRTDEIAPVGATGGDARLIVRPKVEDNTVRSVRTVAVKSAPLYLPGAGPTGSLLGIGDSIMYLQGAYLTKFFLEQYGYRPVMLGSMLDGGGVPVEGRAGNTLSTYTYATTASVFSPNSAGLSGWRYLAPVAIGGEAAYQALPSTGAGTTRQSYNPFLRAAAGGDSAGIIRNGQVLDFALYSTRFLAGAVPDIVFMELGVNDATQIYEGAGGGEAGLQAVYDVVLSEEKLFLSRMIAAWPSVRIVRFLSTFPRNGSVDFPRWAALAQVIRAIHQAKADLGYARHVIAPTWAMMDAEAGIELATRSTNAQLGTVTATISDYVHPARASRHQMYRTVAGFCAGAMEGYF